MRDIGRYFKEGAFDCYGSKPKEFIPALIGAAVSVGSTIFGAINSAKKEKAAERTEAASHNRQQAYWNRKANESYVDTAAGQNMLRQAREYADKNWKKAQGAAAVGGGTDAATAQAKEAGNKVVSNTLANMAAQDTARQDAAGKAMMNEDSKYASQKANDLRMHGQTVANAASAMGNAAMQLGAGLENTGSTTAKTTGDSTPSTTAETSTAKAVGDAPVSSNVSSDAAGNRIYTDGATVYKNGEGAGVDPYKFNKRYEDNQA